MDKFGWFYERNGSTWSDGVLTMDTGTNDIAKLGDIRQVPLIGDFNSLTFTFKCIFPLLCKRKSFNTNFREWNGEDRSLYAGSCGLLKGTAAGFLNPNPERQFIEYFSTDICRPIRYSYSTIYICV